MKNAAVKVVAVGDLSFNGQYDRLLRRHGPEYPFRHVLQYWRDADVLLGNLESPATSRPRATPCKLTLRGSPRLTESLAQAGFTCLSVANNHMMDFGAEGLLEACARVAETGMLVVGAGKTIDEAYRPVVLEVQDRKVGILAFCDVVQDSPLYASKSSCGVARGNLATCLYHIHNLRPNVDWLIVHMHWGTELAQLPSPLQRQWAQEMVAAGTNVIIGHHPHVVQPIERIGHAVVAYSLGDFLFSESFWRGSDRRGCSFCSKLRLNSLSRRTGWLELSLADNGVVEHRFRPALLAKKLHVVIDESSRRAWEETELAERLAANDYIRAFEAEFQRAATRRARDGRYRTPARWLELKMFDWGILPWAVTDLEATKREFRLAN